MNFDLMNDRAKEASKNEQAQYQTFHCFSIPYFHLRLIMSTQTRTLDMIFSGKMTLQTN